MLTIYAREPDAFQTDEVKLLGQLARDLAFGVAALRSEQERLRIAADLEYSATHDRLTGLANRHLLLDRIEQAIKHAERDKRAVAVMLVDLDRFKTVNDSLSHEVGDALLQETARRLALHVRAGDTVARLGGDEFMVVLPEMASADEAAMLAHRMLEKISQPMHVGEHDIVGAEALIRWRHPHAGMLQPSQFIPLAEESGLIVPIGAWALRAVCSQVAAWQAAGLDKLVVAVNLSARQLAQEDLTEQLELVLRESGIDASRLELEVTESALMADPDRATAILRALKGLGVRIALDDFGTGYSSLSYLKRFPIDTLKIDQSFVSGLSVDSDDAAIAKLVIELGHALCMKVVAEGVETSAQLGFLRRQGCDEMQGYLFSRPLPADAFAGLVRENCQLSCETGP